MNILDQMLSRYSISNRQQKLDALREIVQQISLAGLADAGFFEKAAFYGGTCLRIFHGLPRFSEDMDFSLLNPDPGFKLESYFGGIHEAFRQVGIQVSISKKNKSHVTAIQSAFLKSETIQYDLKLEPGRSIKIKIEVDTTPPLMFSTEYRELELPRSFSVRCFTLPCLFAGKLHALIYRAWAHRVKGRDWYDFAWYVKRRIPLDYRHFVERVLNTKQARHEAMTVTSMRDALRKKIQSVDIREVIYDVEPFVEDDSELNVWDEAYFISLAEQMLIDDGA